MIYTQYFVGILNKYHTIAFLGKCESKVSIQSMISQYDQSPSSSLGECWIFSFIHHMVNMGSIQKHYLCFTVSSVTLWWMEYVHFFVGNQWACHEFYNVKMFMWTWYGSQTSVMKLCKKNRHIKGLYGISVAYFF